MLTRRHRRATALLVLPLAQLALAAPATADGWAPTSPASSSGDVTCAGTSCTVVAGSTGTAPRDPQPGGPQAQGPSVCDAPGSTPVFVLMRDCGPQNVTVNGRSVRAGVVPPPGGAPAPPSPAQVAQQAVAQLQLPTLTIRTSPSGDLVVNLPTWLWVEGGWAPVSATAAVTAVSVTATAVPEQVEWSTGDGATVTCKGPGTAFDPAKSDPAAASPDCGYTYRRSSAGLPGSAYTLTATVTWGVTWAGAGQQGAVPGMQTTATATVRVAEVQSVVVAS